jgi:hypothetical protein
MTKMAMGDESRIMVALEMGLLNLPPDRWDCSCGTGLGLSALCGYVLITGS